MYDTSYDDNMNARWVTGLKIVGKSGTVKDWSLATINSISFTHRHTNIFRNERKNLIVTNRMEWSHI
jgi:hypothetical protein